MSTNGVLREIFSPCVSLNEGALIDRIWLVFSMSGKTQSWSRKAFPG